MRQTATERHHDEHTLLDESIHARLKELLALADTEHGDHGPDATRCARCWAMEALRTIDLSLRVAVQLGREYSHDGD